MNIFIVSKVCKSIIGEYFFANEMSKSGEYIRGSKRLAIIQKWLNGYEDPIYEVLPTRKEGKYIVKKRDSRLDEKEADEKADEKAADEKAAVDKADEEPEVEEEELNEEEEEPVEIKPVKPKLRPKPKIIPRINNDDSYLFYQILIQLQHITQILEMNREDKERDRMVEDIVNETMRLQEKNKNKENDEISIEEIYKQPIQMALKRRNNIFADMA